MQCIHWGSANKSSRNTQDKKQKCTHPKQTLTMSVNIVLRVCVRVLACTYPLLCHLWPAQCSAVPSRICRRSADTVERAEHLSVQTADTHRTATTPRPTRTHRQYERVQPGESSINQNTQVGLKNYIQSIPASNLDSSLISDFSYLWALLTLSAKCLYIGSSYLCDNKSQAPMKF